MSLISFKSRHHLGKYNQTERPRKKTVAHIDALCMETPFSYKWYSTTVYTGLAVTHVFILLHTSLVWFTVRPAWRWERKITPGSDTLIIHGCCYLQLCPKSQLSQPKCALKIAPCNCSSVFHEMEKKRKEKESNTHICNY